MQENRKNKVALITGCARRIGKEIAIHLAKNGWKIIIHYNNSKQFAEDLASILKDVTETYSIQFDLSKKQDYHAIFKKISEDFHSPSLLINNAAIFAKDNFEDLTLDRLESHLRINCTSAILLSQAFIKNNNFDDLNIINIGDYSAAKVNTSYFSYYHSKHLLSYTSKIIASKVAPKCRVNSINLGHVMCDDARTEEEYEKIYSNTPMKEKVTIENLNNSIDFILCSSHVTGAEINVDGGASIQPHRKL